MKSALKARDTNRLNILRALLADSTNAAKSSKPVTTDLHVLALLKKRAAASRSASAEFGAANRGDLQETEDQQRGVLEEYMAGVETVGAEEVRRVVVEVVDGLKKEGGKFGVGEVIGRVVGKGGVLEDKNVDRGEVARVVKEVVTA
ncbi:MAG: hypothetical protein M1833_004576 [Piccolia ochrophora]|nr:MAG: hypothetical protein M1833_004576 [Piccolia ochrophora]